MLLTDTDLTAGCKMCRMITREDYGNLYPKEEHRRTMPYIFRHKIPTEVPDDQAKVLLKKYPTLQMTSDCDEIIADNTELKSELDDLGWHALKKYATEKCGMSYKETNIKRVDLTDEILQRLGK